MNAATLHRELSAWDGKSVEYLQLLYPRYASGAAGVRLLIEALSAVELQVAATWLLNRVARNSPAALTPHGAEVCARLPHLVEWEAQLHALQLLHVFMPFPAAHRLPLEWFVRECLVASNKFVRAWAYNALGLLADSFPQYAAERDRRYEYGLAHESASIRARIRHAQRRADARRG